MVAPLLPRLYDGAPTFVLVLALFIVLVLYDGLVFATPVLVPGLVAAAEPVFLTLGLADALVLATRLLLDR